MRSICQPGSHVVLPHDAYGGTFRLLDKVHRRWGIVADPAPISDLAAVESAIRPGETTAVWIETPTNPLLAIADIAAIAELAHAAGALVVVDNTFATPYLQQPLELGADVVLHSTTKYCGGHSDVVGGALVVDDEELAEKIKFHQNAIGAVAGPFDAWLVLRGLKTLARPDGAAQRQRRAGGGVPRPDIRRSPRCSSRAWTPIPVTTWPNARCVDPAGW